MGVSEEKRSGGGNDDLTCNVGTHAIHACVGFYGWDLGGMVVECIVGSILFVLENPSHKCF